MQAPIILGQFVASQDTLRIYAGQQLAFVSQKPGLRALMEYLETEAGQNRDITVFDRVMGNAAALLAIQVGAHAVLSPLGSNAAMQTLKRYGVACYFTEVVPYIHRKSCSAICPLEKLSLGKEPAPFYLLMKEVLKPEAMSC